MNALVKMVLAAGKNKLSPPSDSLIPRRSSSQIVEEEKIRLGNRYKSDRHLLIASYEGDLDLVKYLVEHEQVNRNHINMETFPRNEILAGESALRVAQRFQHNHIVEYLSQNGFQSWQGSNSLQKYFREHNMPISPV